MKTSDPNILSVSALNACARSVLEEALGHIWIEGEISNLAQPSSSHCYFSLKDADAQVRCALFRGQRQKFNFELKNGLHVLLHAEVSLYEPRGDYQLIVSHVEAAGEGLLQRAFEALKKKLDAEGLFLELHKKSIPKFPKQIGIISSATGAALHDILHVLKRRFASIPVIIYPAQVQGERASAQLIQTIHTANQRQECDVLILARGGGSLEDLWPFNNEALAYAIFNSTIPIISGVGHEVDFTIADFVADVRAPTPSAAAELASPHAAEYVQITQQLRNRLTHLITTFIKQTQLSLSNLSKRLQHPEHRIQLFSKELMQLQKQFKIQMHYYLQRNESALRSLMDKLHAYSPLDTLKRGFAIVKKDSDQSILRKATEVKTGDLISATLAEGSLKARVL